MSDALIGLRGDGFVVLAADMSAARSIVVFKNDEDKIYELDDHLLLAAAGPTADRNAFCEFIKRNICLQNYRNSTKLSTKAAASFVRTELSSALRQSPYQVNLLLAGCDKPTSDEEKAQPLLYYLDYLGSMHPVDKAAHGYGSYFVLSILDRYWRRGMNLEQCLDVMRKCFKELQTRFVMNCPKFIVKVVDKDGSRTVEV